MEPRQYPNDSRLRKSIVKLISPFLASGFIRLLGIFAVGARYRSFNSLHNRNVPVSIRQSFPHNNLLTEPFSYLISNFNNPDALHRTTWSVIFFNSLLPLKLIIFLGA